jgi:hypothetical protein
MFSSTRAVPETAAAVAPTIESVAPVAAGTTVDTAAAAAVPRRALGATLRGARKVSWPWLAVGVLTGVAAMFYLDPRQGRRRRALVRDKLAHLRKVVTRRVPRTIERRGRFYRGVATGVAHEAAGVMLNGHDGIVDDETLVARVRSAVLRRQSIKSGEIHIDAYEGCVTLRGQVDSDDEIRRLVEDTRHIEGVREVRSYLHLPGTPPPNKAEVLERVPALYSTR